MIANFDRALSRSLAVLGLSACVWACAAAGAAEAPLYKDPAAPVEKRIDDLVARMTLDEKIAQITSVWDDKATMFDDKLRFDPAKARKRIPNGIGQFSRPSDANGPGSARASYPGATCVRPSNSSTRCRNTRSKTPGSASRSCSTRKRCTASRRSDATSFPQAIGLASIWDPDLVRDVNAVIAREIRARGVHLVLSPVVDVARDPRWGRIEETFGEDPYLVGEMGVAAVEGLQGDGTDRKLAPGKVFATLKHMTGHGQPESGTNVGPAQISERDAARDFLPAVRAGREAHRASVR